MRKLSSLYLVLLASTVLQSKIPISFLDKYKKITKKEAKFASAVNVGNPV
jgi:hypothetical protein